MSTIEKLFVQIFDRKRQIIEQLNHQKQLFDQTLASKLLIQGITPPPWLLNSDKFATSSASSSDPKDFNKEELISGLLLPCPQPQPSYSNATHFYGKPLSSVSNDELQHDLFNATSAGCKGLDDCRPGVLPQCLFRGLEDVHHPVVESPQERVTSNTCADLDKSLARMQRSKSRQKAFELRSSRKVSVKCQLEDNPPTGPRSQDVLKEGSATTVGGILSSSKDESLSKQQDVSSKEEGDLGCTENEAHAPTSFLSPHSHHRDLSVEESLVAADSVSGKGQISTNLLKESVVKTDESCDRRRANSNLLTEELIESQDLSVEERISTLDSKCDDTRNAEDVERLVAIDLAENTIDRAEFLERHSRSASLGVPLSHDRKMDVPVGVLEQSDLANTSALNDITGQLLKGDYRCPASETDAATNCLSPHSDCQNLSVEESLVAADSVSSKGGVCRYLLKESVVGIDGSGDRKPANSNLLTDQLMGSQGLSKEDDMCHTKELDASSDLLSPEEYIAQLEVEQPNSNLLAEEFMESQGHAKEDDMCNTKELDASSDLLPSEEHLAQLEAEQPNSLSSEREKHTTSSSGKDEVLGEIPARGPLDDNLLQMVGGQALKLSSAELNIDHDLENHGGLCSGESSRESQGGYVASNGECNTEIRFSSCITPAECRGPTANEPAARNLEVNIEHASVRQKQKLDDAEPQAAELQAICFSKEVKSSVSLKLLEVQTLNTDCSPTSVVCGSWPQQKRRKIESVISKSASPHLMVNPSSILSGGVYAAKSCTGDFSAKRTTQNGFSSLSDLPEHSSIMQSKEEKRSSQGSSIEPEKLQVQSVSCSTQQLTASQKCLHEADLTTEKCDFSFSISKVDADPVDNKIWRGKNSLEVRSILNCLGGSPFMEHNEAVGARGDKPDLECFTFEKKWEDPPTTGDIDVNMNNKVDDNVATIKYSSPTVWCQLKSLPKVKDFNCLCDSPMEQRDTVGRKASMSDIENFTFDSECDDTHATGEPERLVAIDLPKNTIDRAEFLERLCRSASLGFPLSHFHASYGSGKKMDVCHSVPVGVLEQTDMRITSTLDDGSGEVLKSGHTCSEHVENSEYQDSSFSDYSPAHGTPFAWDFKGPYTSPFGMAIEGVTAKSRSSSKRGSSNPELTCFPIEESGEEDVDAEDDGNYCSEGTGSASAFEKYMDVVALDPASRMDSSGSLSEETSIDTSDKQRSSSPDFTLFPVEESSEQHLNMVAAQTFLEKSGSGRQPLCDISKNVTAPAVHHTSKRATESFSRASSTSEMNTKISQNSQPHQSGRLRKRKETQNNSLGTTAKKQYESRDTRFGKPKVSAKSGVETRSGVFSKEPQPSNIVSSMKSFLPLVQQKQAASCAPVKKEVRVKALEAAEAAKRLAEKKENDRKQKKEALKLERARLEQEKLKRLELLKKAKEEERKRKDAEMAERKRQREEEEEERKEKERKRKRVGEARKQKKEHGDKMPVDKEECKSQAEDGETDRTRGVDAGMEEKRTGGQEVERAVRNQTNNQATSSVLPIASGDVKINELGVSSDPCQKQKDVSANVAGCSTPTPDSSATQTVREKSYDISPYCCSDDEEDEDDEIPNTKFIPSWASKSSIKMALTSLNTVDPEVIFPPSSFCNLNEVLLPRELKQR